MPLGAPDRMGKVAAALAVTGLGAAGAYAFWAGQGGITAGPVRDGEMGFVLTEFAYAVGPDADEASCPQGMSRDVVDVFSESPEGQRRSGESDQDYSERLESTGQALSFNADGKHFCINPELAPIDEHARMLLSATARADGINIDGAVSRSAADIRSGRHDFVGLDGTEGVDNQFWRAVGCTKSFQSDGQSNAFGIEMQSGAWGVVVQLSDVDDLANDDHVEVGIYANADPMQVSPTREALDFATYAMEQDENFRASTTGRIINGVLTTEPVDVRFRRVVNAMYLERPLRSARIQATLSSEGELKGYMAGYTPVDDMYDLQFGFRSGKNGDGTPASFERRSRSAWGSARSGGRTCEGMWQSLNRLADGDQDRTTGRFTSISTQYRFTARPAFLVDIATSSQNETLNGVIPEAAGRQ